MSGQTYPEGLAHQAIAALVREHPDVKKGPENCALICIKLELGYPPLAALAHQEHAALIASRKFGKALSGASR